MITEIYKPIQVSGVHYNSHLNALQFTINSLSSIHCYIHFCLPLVPFPSSTCQYILCFLNFGLFFHFGPIQ